MQNDKKKLNGTILEAIKFGLVGVSNTGINFIIYSLLIFCSFPYAIANLVGYAISTLNSYLLNSKYVFKQEKNAKNITKFILVNIIMYVISTLLLTLFIELLHVNPYIAQIFSIIICTIINFVVTKFWTFKS